MMSGIKELIVGNPFFGILLSIAAFAIGSYIYQKTKLPLLNPLALAIAIVCSTLLLFHIDYEQFNEGGQFITLMLAPVTVVLAVPLFEQLPLIKKNAVVILVSIASGVLISIVSIFASCKLFGLDRVLFMSLAPKSVTTAIAIGISDDLGGVKVVTVLAVILSGIVGATIGPSVCRLLRIKNAVAVGLALGTSAHAIGTSKAMELGENQGAMSALAIGVAGLITVVVAPLLIALLIHVWGY